MIKQEKKGSGKTSVGSKVLIWNHHTHNIQFLWTDDWSCTFSFLSIERKEFVDAFFNYVFTKSVEGAFGEFKRGFFKVCDMDVVDFFQPEELQAVMVGQESYDWPVFKQVCWKPLDNIKSWEVLRTDRIYFTESNRMNQAAEGNVVQ